MSIGERTYRDDIARKNAAVWNESAARGDRYSKPWLDLDPTIVRDFAAGRLPHLPRPYIYMYPQEVFRDVAGKDVLLLATGGGQQSAIFGILGARVTVLDISAGQLAADRVAAERYGYDVRTVEGDMRDLSAFAGGSFDLVYQEISLVFVPDVREVYREVARVLRPGGTYRVAHQNPATYLVDESSWDETGYRIGERFRGGRIPDESSEDCAEFRHLLSDMFGGLAACGFAIAGVWEDPCHLVPDHDAAPGTYEHLVTYVALYFAIVARRTA